MGQCPSNSEKPDITRNLDKLAEEKYLGCWIRVTTGPLHKQQTTALILPLNTDLSYDKSLYRIPDTTEAALKSKNQARFDDLKNGKAKVVLIRGEVVFSSKHVFCYKIPFVNNANCEQVLTETLTEVFEQCKALGVNGVTIPLLTKIDATSPNGQQYVSASVYVNTLYNVVCEYLKENCGSQSLINFLLGDNQHYDTMKKALKEIQAKGLDSGVTPDGTPAKQGTEIMITGKDSIVNKDHTYSSLRDVNPMEVNSSDKGYTEEQADVVAPWGETSEPPQNWAKKDTEITHLTLSRYGTREDETITAVEAQVDFVKRESNNFDDAKIQAEKVQVMSNSMVPIREEAIEHINTVEDVQEVREPELVASDDAPQENQNLPEPPAEEVLEQLLAEFKGESEVKVEPEVIATPTKEPTPELHITVEPTPKAKRYPKLSNASEAMEIDSPMKPKTPPMVQSPGTANKNKKSLDLNASEIETFAQNSQSDFDPNALETQKNSVFKPANQENADQENVNHVPFTTISKPETPNLQGSPTKNTPTPMTLAMPGINVINDDFITCRESTSGRDLSGNNNLKTNADFMTAVDINSNVMADDVMSEKDMEPISEEGTVQTRSETLNISNYKENIGVTHDEPELAHRQTFGGELPPNLLVDENMVKGSMKKGGMNKKRGMKK